MRLITANIKALPLMKQAHVVHDIKAVAGTSGVIFWQEILPARYKEALTSSLGGVWRHVHLDTEIPISYRSDIWELVPTLTGKVETHKGRLHVTPSRWITWVGLKRKHSNLPPVVFMNTHMISGSFSNNYPTTKKWRRSQWDIHFKHQQALINTFINNGHTVLGGGDTNRGATMPKYMPTQRWLAKGGIDHLWCIEHPNGVQVSLVESTEMSGLYTDHKPRIAQLGFHLPAAAKVDLR